MISSDFNVCLFWNRIALLAFHITLVRNPQEAIVLHAFASLLYHRNWREALRFARENENSVAGYVPEVSKKSSRKRSDEDLAEAVSEFASLLRDTQYVLTDMESLHEALYHFPSFKRSGLVCTQCILVSCTTSNLANVFNHCPLLQFLLDQIVITL